ncbi:MAG: response regulator [Spirochaetaceae bacterium]|jgi:putative two-component system response regulator|nr:response regulator [Spirochaetaceae bacterium]
MKTTKHGVKKIVLAVDDMPVNLTAIKNILHDDFDVRPAKSVKTALAMLNTIKADLILLDIEMPEMSGFEFLNHIRNDAGQPEQKNIPVIFVTSHAAEDFIARANTCGVEGYVIKPIIPAVLLEKINSVFEAAEREASASQSTISP